MGTEADPVKIVVFGAGAVGKSALVNMFVKKNFIEFYDPTIEESYKAPLDLDGRRVMLDILDTAGQDDFAPMRASWIRQGKGFMLVYAINDSTSFDEVDRFYRDIDKTKGNSDSPIVVVGNKSDLPNRQVAADEGKGLAGRYKGQFVETSAKTGDGVNQAFETLVRMILDKESAGSPSAQAAASGGDDKNCGACVLV